MIRNTVTPRDVQAVRHIIAPLVLGAAFGDGLTLVLLLAKWAGAAIPWMLVLLPFVCGLAFILALIGHGLSLAKAQREEDIRAALLEEERQRIEEEEEASDFANFSDDLPSTRG